jgi:hypothetical protein
MIVEPGAFRAEFNTNEYVTEEMAAYRDTAGATRRFTVEPANAEPKLIEAVPDLADVLTIGIPLTPRHEDYRRGTRP